MSTTYFKNLGLNNYIKLSTPEQYNKVAPYLRGKLELYNEGTILPTYVSPVLNHEKIKSFGVQDDISNLTEVPFENLRFTNY